MQFVISSCFEFKPGEQNSRVSCALLRDLAGGDCNADLLREFDPGSESTLAARLTHASRTRKWGQLHEYSGARVSNTWITCLGVWNNPGKPGLIPHTFLGTQVPGRKG